MKKASSFFILLSMLCWFLTSNSAHALDIPRDCRDLQMLQQKWETQYFYDLKFNSYLKNGIPPLKCDSLPYKFVKAIWAIENLKTSPEFGNIYEQLKTHVREFQIIPQNGIDGKVLCGNTTTEIGRIALYLCAFSESEKKDTYPWPEEYYVSHLLNLISTIVHELVHLKFPEASDHLSCVDRKGTCDYSFEHDVNTTTSSYSFEILYLQSVLKNNNFDEHDIVEIKANISHIFKNGFINPVSK